MDSRALTSLEAAVKVRALTRLAGTVMYISHRAEVAKLVDAPASGAGGGNSVKVRVFSSAPIFICSHTVL